MCPVLKGPSSARAVIVIVTSAQGKSLAATGCNMLQGQGGTTAGRPTPSPIHCPLYVPCGYYAIAQRFFSCTLMFCILVFLHHLSSSQPHRRRVNKWAAVLRRETCRNLLHRTQDPSFCLGGDIDIKAKCSKVGASCQAAPPFSLRCRHK